MPDRPVGCFAQRYLAAFGTLFHRARRQTVELAIKWHVSVDYAEAFILVIEAVAQVLSLYVNHVLDEPGFVGFGGITDAKFRSTVAPGNRLYLLAHAILLKKRKKTFKVQGIVNGSMVFEATVEGLRI